MEIIRQNFIVSYAKSSKTLSVNFRLMDVPCQALAFVPCRRSKTFQPVSPNDVTLQCLMKPSSQVRESLPRTLSSTFVIGDRSGGQGERGVTPTIVLCPRPLPRVTPIQRRKGITLILTTIRRPSPRSYPAQAKTLNYLNNLLAKWEAAERGAFEGLLLTGGGYVAECSMSNVCFIKGRTLYTPSLACGVLPGITREVVLEMAPTLGLQIREGRYRPAFLYEADECFLTGSGVGILPVAAIDGRPFPKQTSRSWTATLQTRYEHLLRAQGR